MTFARPWTLVLASCGLVALTLAVWPVPRNAPPPDKAPETYRGPDYRTRAVAPQGAAPVLRLATADAPTTQAASAPSPVLVGIAGGRDAYLKSAVTGAVTRVGPGDVLDGWRVTGVDSRSATVVLGEERRRLRLFDRPAPSAPAVANAVSGG